MSITLENKTKEHPLRDGEKPALEPILEPTKAFPKEEPSNEEKAKENLKNHQVSFHEGATIFHDLYIKTMYDPDHSENEDRHLSLGYSSKGRLLVVSYTERENNIRLISCRKATRQERKIYETELL